MKHQRISEFAASINVSHTAIRKAINRGRIPPDLVRTKELTSGRKVTLIINPVAARAAFLATHRDITGALDEALGANHVVADSVGTLASDSRSVWNADDVAQMVHEEYEFARKILMAIPARVAEPVAACADAGQVRTILEDAIRDALTDLTSDIDQFYASDISGIEPGTSASIDEEIRS